LSEVAIYRPLMFVFIGLALVALGIFVWGLTRLTRQEVTVSRADDELPATFSRDRLMGKTRITAMPVTPQRFSKCESM